MRLHVYTLPYIALNRLCIFSVKRQTNALAKRVPSLIMYRASLSVSVENLNGTFFIKWFEGPGNGK